MFFVTTSDLIIKEESITKSLIGWNVSGRYKRQQFSQKQWCREIASFSPDFFQEVLRNGASEFSALSVDYKSEVRSEKNAFWDCFVFCGVFADA